MYFCPSFFRKPHIIYMLILFISKIYHIYTFIRLKEKVSLFWGWPFRFLYLLLLYLILSKFSICNLLFPFLHWDCGNYMLIFFFSPNLFTITFNLALSYLLYDTIMIWFGKNVKFLWWEFLDWTFLLFDNEKHIENRFSHFIA